MRPKIPRVHMILDSTLG